LAGIDYFVTAPLLLFKRNFLQITNGWTDAYAHAYRLYGHGI